MGYTDLGENPKNIPGTDKVLRSLQKYDSRNPWGESWINGVGNQQYAGLPFCKKLLCLRAGKWLSCGKDVPGD